MKFNHREHRGARRKALQGTVGQLLIIGFDRTEMTPRLRSLLTRLQPAGVILFARNIESGAQTRRLLGECQKHVTSPLFTCVDLEGGTVDRFRDVLGPAPSAAAVFGTGDRKLYRRHGALIGGSCRALGFNVDFAPVLDLAFETSRSVMGTRAVSVNPRETVAYAKEFLAGLESARVLGCGKHFPGLGEGKLDSHHDLPVIEKSLKKLWSEDLLPYRLLRRQLPFVMISHAAFPQVTHDQKPASLSKKWISEILRKRIGYRNLIVSDDLEMGGVLASAPIGAAAVEFVRAGGDLCLICHREDYILEAYEELTQASSRDKKFAVRVTEALRRVGAFKKRFARVVRLGGGARERQSASPAAIEKLSRSLWEFSERVRIASLDHTERSSRT